jgi:hypothetical protein
MTDYDATAVFDRALHPLSIITCHRLGMPQISCVFMYNLLHHMEFHILTGFRKSTSSFKNNEDPYSAGQGILQSSSLAALIYNVNSDVSLTVCRKLVTGASFIHPITRQHIHDKATQYIDDKTDLLNDIGAGLKSRPHISQNDREALFNEATSNSSHWASILWISGGSLNTSK